MFSGMFWASFFTLFAFSIIAWVISLSKNFKGEWSIAFRFVPPICALMALAAILSFSLLFPPVFSLNLNHTAKSILIISILFLIPIFISILGYYINNFIYYKLYKKYYFDLKYIKTTSFIVFILSGILSIFIAGIYSFLFLFSLLPDSIYWDNINIPADKNFTFQQRATHPFLAEYDYRLKFKSGKILGMFCNTGGKTEFNLYTLKDGKILMVDKEHSYIVDFKNECAFVIIDDILFPLSHVLIDGFDGVLKNHNVKVSDTSYTLLVYQKNVKDAKALELSGSPIKDVLVGKKYFGRLEHYYYIPASASLEKELTVPFEQACKAANKED